MIALSLYRQFASSVSYADLDMEKASLSQLQRLMLVPLKKVKLLNLLSQLQNTQVVKAITIIFQHQPLAGSKLSIVLSLCIVLARSVSWILSSYYSMFLLDPHIVQVLLKAPPALLCSA